jgi:hypothetical protein
MPKRYLRRLRASSLLRSAELHATPNRPCMPARPPHLWLCALVIRRVELNCGLREARVF